MPWGTRGMSLAEKLAHYSDRSGGPDACWPWLGSTNGKGYGNLLWEGRRELAHRLAWRCAHGPIPVGMLACHDCDNRPCINDTHLFIGTHVDNSADMYAKGRQAPGHATAHAGESNGRCKLTPAMVLAIRADRRFQREIAAAFGISQGQVCRLKRRTHWRYLDVGQAELLAGAP